MLRTLELHQQLQNSINEEIEGRIKTHQTENCSAERESEAGSPIRRLRRFAAEQQEVTWWEVRFGVKGARRSGSRKPSRHWCFVPVH